MLSPAHLALWRAPWAGLWALVAAVGPVGLGGSPDQLSCAYCLHSPCRPRPSRGQYKSPFLGTPLPRRDHRPTVTSSIPSMGIRSSRTAYSNSLLPAHHWVSDSAPSGRTTRLGDAWVQMCLVATAVPASNKPTVAPVLQPLHMSSIVILHPDVKPTSIVRLPDRPFFLFLSHLLSTVETRSLTPPLRQCPSS